MRLEVWGACHLNAGFRVAVYYAPELDDPLWKVGCNWLGRDPERGVLIPQLKFDGIDRVTRQPRVYGFHCTLKPPFRLSTDYDRLRADVIALAQAARPFEMPQLSVADLSGFLALQTATENSKLQALADHCVAWLDQHREAPTVEELQRRRDPGLAKDAEALLLRWGYPAVFGRWRFHMTLTGRLTPDEHAIWQPIAERHFAVALQTTRQIESLCLFTQTGPKAPFLLAERFRLG